MQSQERPYEFDGFQPVAMTGALMDHHRIVRNLNTALDNRLRGSACESVADGGVATLGDAVRYPDALVTCTRTPGDARLVEGVVAVFEVVSPISGRVDRIEKLGEYRAVPSLRRYFIIERTTAAVTMFARADGVFDWTAVPLKGEDAMTLPEVGIAIPVAELYRGVDLEDSDA